jgi:stage II sporulation protein D
VGLAAALGAAAPAGADAIRVLLRESSGPVEVGGADGRHTTFVAAGAGLRAAGREVGPVYRVHGARPLRAAELRVRGTVEVRRARRGLIVVNELALDDYVAGTLGREVYRRWHPEALKAHAIVTRTYALHERARRRGEPWDLRGDTGGQVYGGLDAESPEVVAATRATRGQYLAFEGRPILAVYHSAAGGRTASAEEVWGRAIPYLRSVAVEHEDDSPDAYWRAAFPGPTLGRALAPVGVHVGPVRELRVAERSPSGRARSVRIRGDAGETELSARELRRVLGEGVIRSTLFEVRDAPEGFVFVGSGHGHGVGMSQWGAQSMAMRGAGYREILATFYPGTQLVAGRP